MSDENSYDATLAQQSRDPNSALAKENADLRARLAALEKSNVVDGGFTGEAPRYQLNEAGYYDETWFAPGTVLEFTGVPNMTMAPMNEPAKRMMRENIKALEEGGRRVAMMRGRDFLGLVTDRNVLIDTLRADTKAETAAQAPVIQMPTPAGQVPPMPHTEEARAIERRLPGRPRKVLSSTPPLPTGMPDTRGQMLAPAPAPAGQGPAVVARVISG